YGEKKIAPFISRFKLKAFGRPDFVDKNNPLEIDIKEAQKALNFASCIIQSKIYDLVILDEVNVALDFKLIKLSDLLKILDDKPEEVEVVLTGRAAHREVIKRADLVTEMKEIKHYYKENFSARKGIEY
ncbi:MAG: cob(I)yrinic acid a,c-diamide adenosyltransferase, partial [Armatimonadetes bacterium]|nr:cob(I)yrinic acid a,c-diamide adenosyltransferase [Armatimonadota bacterium]